MSKQKQNISLPLSEAEKQHLRRKKLSKRALLAFDRDEIAAVLEVPEERAQEIVAWAEFQMVPSIGIKFAEDLIFLGYYSLADLRDKEGANLLEEYEAKKGYWIDPCVEDQFRLVVHYANQEDRSKKWWDFTAARKKYRSEHGYPADRPTTPWHQMVPIKRK